MAKQTKKSSKADSKQLLVRRHKKHRILVSSIVIFLAILIAGILLVTLATRINDGSRLYRINQIYSSLGLDTGSKYLIQHESVFGDKRVYEWDKSRSYSSEKDYIHADTVDNTVKELDKIIKAQGFKYIDEPYPGSVIIQYHYKSDKGEFIRLTVSSKLRDDAFQNSYLMTGSASEEVFKVDPNAGPSNVVIKVNLDDNNE